MQTWLMPDAKGRLSEVVKPAETEGPPKQHLARLFDGGGVVARGTEAVVGPARSGGGFMRAWPMDVLDDALVFERDTRLTRDLPL